MASVRIRLEFEDRHILKKQYRREGLNRSWLLIKPQVRTISDLSLHILTSFGIINTCSNDLILTVDGYGLPPFESISVLKDNDIIRVKKINHRIKYLENGETYCMGEYDTVESESDEYGSESDEYKSESYGCTRLEDTKHIACLQKLLVPRDLKLQENEVFEKETGGYEDKSAKREEDHSKEKMRLENTPCKKNERLAIDNQQLVHTGVNPQAGDEYEKETGGYESDSEDNDEVYSRENMHLEMTPTRKTSSKKRKESGKGQSSEKKKRKRCRREIVPEDVENVDHNEQDKCLQNGVLPQKISVTRNKSSKKKGELDRNPTFEKSTNIKKSILSAKMSDHAEDTDVSMGALERPGEMPKIPSRSARRKKAKRKWLRELANAEKKEVAQMQVLQLDNQQSHDKENKHLEEHKWFDQNTGTEEVIIPRIIRPGHIRFESVEEVDADQIVRQNQVPMETFQWNGITSKKKGQKWGREKSAPPKRNDYENTNQEYIESPTVGEELHLSDAIEFDKLTPCACFPEEGDVVAYRLIELSSFWTPEVSSFRIGKVSWCNSESNRIMLIPVPEYPIEFEKKMDDDDESAPQADTSLYAEDGSLEIDFTSLIDLRMVKNNLDSEKVVTGTVNEVHKADEDTVSGSMVHNENKEPRSSNQENGDANPWEEISQALRAKKEQLTQGDDGSKQDNSGRRSWSHKNLRSSALGPTMAFLRAQDEL